MWGSACLVQVQVHHEAAGEHPPRQVGIGEVEHDVPPGLVGADQLRNLDLDHDEDDDVDEEEDGDDEEELTTPSSAFTVETARPSTVPFSTA